MKVVGIIQARSSSSRLPGKVLLEAAGKPLILHMFDRVIRCASLDSLWLATSDREEDDPLAGLVESAGYMVFRGSLENVLSRFWRVGQREKAEVIVRLTGDCPLHDPEVIDSVVEFFVKNKKVYDYASNVLPPSFPDGLDTEVFSYRALEKAYQEASMAFDLEHVSPYIRRIAEERARIGNYNGPANFSHLRWTLDEPEDYTFIKSVYEALYPVKANFRWLDVISWQTQDSERLTINAMHRRNEGSSNA